LLDEMSNSSVLISKLFYSSEGLEGLNNRTKEELISILQSVDNERLILINKSLQIYEYLKYNSMTRLILTCLINEYNEYFAQFLNDQNGEDNIEKFESSNNDILDEIVSFQSIYYENQEDLINSFDSLIKAIQNQSGFGLSLLEILDLNSFQSPPCFIASALESNLNFAREAGNILDEIKYLTFYKFVTKYSSKISGISLVSFLMNPSRNGINGNLLKNVAFQFATNSSEASDVLFDQIAEYMKNNALVESNKLNSAKSDLVTSVQSELDNFKKICTQCNDSRNNLEEAIKRITLNFGNINFDHAKSNYDPLSTYLAQFRYYNNR